MVIRVTVGPSVPNRPGGSEAQVELPATGPAALSQLLERLGIQSRDSEGALLFFVNGNLVPQDEAEALTLKDGDHLSLHRMLSGG